MPEKRSSVTDFLKGVFKMRRPYYDDIVYQAEKIISDYDAKKRGEIIKPGCRKIPKGVSFLIAAAMGAIVFVLYRFIA